MIQHSRGLTVQPRPARVGLRASRRLQQPGQPCPRCQARHDSIGCPECGWVPDTSVAYCEVEVGIIGA